MTADTEYDTFEHGIGTTLPTDSLRSENDPVGEIKKNSPIAIHGVALPENTVLQGGQGVRHFYPPEMAQRAAEVLQQQLDADDTKVHIVKNFHELEGQASADDIIGEVTAVGYSAGVGVTFQGEITDETTAEKIHLGYLDVSPTVARALGEEMDPQMEARPVSEVGGFRDIAVVGTGQPGANVDVGTNPAIEALHRTLSFDEVAESPDTYSVSTPEFDGWATGEWSAPTLSGTFDGDMEAARNSATWIDGDGEDFGDLSLFIVDGQGQVNTNGLDSAWRMAPQTDGPSEDDVSRLRSMYEGLAEDARDAGALADATWEETWASRVGESDTNEQRPEGDDSAGTNTEPDTMSTDEAMQTLAEEYDLSTDEVETRLTTDPDALGNEGDPEGDDGTDADGGGSGGSGDDPPEEPTDDGRVLLVEAGDADD